MADNLADRMAAVTTHLATQASHNGPITPWVINELLAIREMMNAPQNGGKHDKTDDKHAEASKHKSVG